MSKQYITSAEISKLISESIAADKITPQLAAAFMLIVDRRASSYSFSQYSYLDDMKGEALVNLVKYWKNIQIGPDQNPFAYITQVINTSFFQYIEKEKHLSLLRDVTLSYAGLPTSDSYERNLKSREEKLAKLRDKKLEEKTNKELKSDEDWHDSN